MLWFRDLKNLLVALGVAKDTFDFDVFKRIVVDGGVFIDGHGLADAKRAA